MMYDENDLYNELVGTGQKALNSTKSAVSLVQYLNNISGGKEVSSLLTGSDTSFVFTGQSTDLRYFAKYNEMPISLIEKIPDENLKNAVKDEFNKAALSGKINISPKTGIISITPQGKEFINRPEFKLAAAKDVAAQQTLAAETMEFMLDGTPQDLSYFNFAESLDLKAVMEHPDKESVQKILSNLVKMKNEGLVSVENAAVKLTAKGKEVISTALFKESARGVVSKAAALGGAKGAIFVAVSQAAVKTAQLLSSNGLK